MCDIPYIGWLFGSNSQSIKNSKLIVTASVSYDTMDDDTSGKFSAKSKKGRPQSKETI